MILTPYERAWNEVFLFYILKEFFLTAESEKLSNSLNPSLTTSQSPYIGNEREVHVFILYDFL